MRVLKHPDINIKLMIDKSRPTHPEDHSKIIVLEADDGKNEIGIYICGCMIAKMIEDLKDVKKWVEKDIEPNISKSKSKEENKHTYIG